MSQSCSQLYPDHDLCTRPYHLHIAIWPLHFQQDLGRVQQLDYFSAPAVPFVVWGFDYMEHFPSSNGYTHILVVVVYVTNVGERSNFKKIPMHTQDHGDA